jgi:hypothetical protein
MINFHIKAPKARACSAVKYVKKIMKSKHGHRKTTKLMEKIWSKIFQACEITNLIWFWAPVILQTDIGSEFQNAYSF